MPCCTGQHALKAQDLPCMYLAHLELESFETVAVVIIIVVVVVVLVLVIVLLSLL